MFGGKLYYVPRYTVKNHFSYKKAWERFFKEHREYKVVHAHLTGSASVFLPIAKKYGCITIAHSHIAFSQKGLRAKIVDLYGLPLRRIADYTFACSDLAGEWMFGKNSLNKKNYKLIKNGVDTEKFKFNKDIREEVRTRYNLKEEFVIGEVARFNTQKNHEFLIDIFYELYKLDKNAVLMLVGDGEKRSKIENKVADLKLQNNVIFTGVCPDIHKILSAFDVFVMPSFNEGLPVSLIEAQTAGLPVVASDTITEEVKITPLVEFLSLNTSAEVWAKKIMAYKNSERKDYIEEIRVRGYDICYTTEWLTEFYLRQFD